MEVQIMFAKDLNYITPEMSANLLNELSEIMRMLNSLIQKVSLEII
jgi:four helix bundle protein